MRKSEMRKPNLLVFYVALAIALSNSTACARESGANPASASAATTAATAQTTTAQPAQQSQPVPRREFIAVEGQNLKAKVDEAARRARSDSRGTHFWTAYSFDVRPGVAVDTHFEDRHGSTFVSGVSVSLDSNYESSDVGVFLLRRRDGGEIVEIAVYDLARRREYRGHPIYWLGHAGNEESLNLLTGLAQTGFTEKVTERAALAIAIHDDPRVPGILKTLVRNASAEKVRVAAALWLGHFPEERAFLADLARNERESTEVRGAAVLGIGHSRDLAVIETLRAIYEGTTNRKVREHVFVALSGNKNEDAAVDLLIRIARRETDRDMRKQAIFWLGQKAGERSTKFLGETVDSSDADTEIQKQAVFALSQKPREEAIPTLIRIARTHRNGEVRKQAIFWLGQISDDERALAFFEEILKK